MKNNKLFGPVMMVVGTSVGGGMLALPMVSYSIGFLWSTILMFLICLLCIFSSFMILEVNLGMPAESSSFGSMAGRTLGKIGQGLVWVTYLFLLYATVVAYIVGESNIITEYVGNSFHFKIPHWQSAILFTSLVGIVVDCSVKAVDYLNRVLVLLKSALLIGALLLIFGYVKKVNLVAIPLNDFSYLKYSWLALPIFLCAFNFHTIIPSLRSYYGGDSSSLKKIFIWGLLISFIIYTWWSASVLGVIPIFGADSFTAMHGGGVGELTQMLVNISQSEMFKLLVNGFTNITLITAFLGVSLGLFDFLADGFKLPNTPIGRMKTAILTFIPPLVVALFSPNSFVIALNYAAVCIAILILIVPGLMVLRSRTMKDFKTSYRVKVGNSVLIGTVFLGCVFAILGILYVMGYLPVL